MKEKEVLVGSIETWVKIVDWTPINRIISQKVGVEVECRIGNGLIQNVSAIFKEDEGMDVKHLLIDNECCGLSTERSNHFSSDLNEGEPFCVNWFKGIGFYKTSIDNGDGRKSIAMFPSFYFDIDSDDVIKCLTGAEMPLYLFMGSRYNYNPRIKANEMDILKLVYHNHIVSGLSDWKKTMKKQFDVA